MGLRSEEKKRCKNKMCLHPFSEGTVDELSRGNVQMSASITVIYPISAKKGNFFLHFL